MAKSLEKRYEEAAEKVRSDKGGNNGNGNAANRKNYHALRDELRARASENRAAQPGGAVTADKVEVS
jgi:hypothetical protein